MNGHTCTKCKRRYEADQWAMLKSIGTRVYEAGGENGEDVTFDYRNCIEPGCHGTMAKQL